MHQNDGRIAAADYVVQPDAVDVSVAVGEPVHPGYGTLGRGNLRRAWPDLDVTPWR